MKTYVSEWQNTLPHYHFIRKYPHYTKLGSISTRINITKCIHHSSYHPYITHAWIIKRKIEARAGCVINRCALMSPSDGPVWLRAPSGRLDVKEGDDVIITAVASANPPSVRWVSWNIVCTLLGIHYVSHFFLSRKKCESFPQFKRYVWCHHKCCSPQHVNTIKHFPLYISRYMSSPPTVVFKYSISFP